MNRLAARSMSLRFSALRDDREVNGPPLESLWFFLEGATDHWVGGGEREKHACYVGNPVTHNPRAAHNLLVKAGKISKIASSQPRKTGGY